MKHMFKIFILYSDTKLFIDIETNTKSIDAAYIVHILSGTRHVQTTKTTETNEIGVFSCCR